MKHSAALRALSGLMLAAALAAGCARPEADEVGTVEQQSVPVATAARDAADPEDVAKPSDAAEEL
ncbi:MAG TPA: hypothetical protein VNB06_06680, partial [Thermoanaerobaculia bacterium]|nr:hypothetical protein [Thermoanaerobaculia bacterium]